VSDQDCRFSRMPKSRPSETLAFGTVIQFDVDYGGAATPAILIFGPERRLRFAA
jgi:hypothetical protein